MQKLLNLLDPEWWRFEWRYRRKRTPWDTQITPPEVIAFLEQAAPARALDLGCGTGTNAITLAQYGWQVTGVDFSPRAIAMARRKSSQKGLSITFRIGDVANLDDLAGPYDYALDIGCLFSLKLLDRRKYAAGLVRMMPAGAHFMLYAWLPQIWHGAQRGISSDDVQALFGHAFIREKMAVGRDGGGKSAWYWFMRK